MMKSIVVQKKIFQRGVRILHANAAKLAVNKHAASLIKKTRAIHPTRTLHSHLGHKTSEEMKWFEESTAKLKE